MIQVRHVVVSNGGGEVHQKHQGMSPKWVNHLTPQGPTMSQRDAWFLQFSEKKPMNKMRNIFGVDTPVVLATLVAMLVLAVLLVLTPMPAAAQSGNVYGEYGAQTIQSTSSGRVIGLRVVQVKPRSQSGYAGAASGAALGGLLSAMLTRNTDNQAVRAALGVVGVTVGGAMGQVAGERVGATDAMEILVEMIEQGGRARIVAVVQPLPAPLVQVGQMVLVLNQGGQTRVIPHPESFVPTPAPVAVTVTPVPITTVFVVMQESP
jgi:outer membrane lipoprotein SlyB